MNLREGLLGSTPRKRQRLPQKAALFLRKLKQLPFILGLGCQVVDAHAQEAQGQEHGFVLAGGRFPVGQTLPQPFAADWTGREFRQVP